MPLLKSLKTFFSACSCKKKRTHNHRHRKSRKMYRGGFIYGTSGRNKTHSKTHSKPHSKPHSKTHSSTKKSGGDSNKDSTRNDKKKMRNEILRARMQMEIYNQLKLNNKKRKSSFKSPVNNTPLVTRDKLSPP